MRSLSCLPLGRTVKTVGVEPARTMLPVPSMVVGSRASPVAVSVPPPVKVRTLLPGRKMSPPTELMTPLTPIVWTNPPRSNRPSSAILMVEVVAIWLLATKKRITVSGDAVIEPAVATVVAGIVPPMEKSGAPLKVLVLAPIKAPPPKVTRKVSLAPMPV